MPRLLPTLLLLLALVYGCRGQQTSAPEATTTPQCRLTAEWTAKGDPLRQPAAVLTDATSLYRICSNRPPGRLLPSHSTKNERTSGKFNACCRQLNVSSHKQLYNGRERTETAPFRFVVSRDYYIIALRRIIR